VKKTFVKISLLVLIGVLFATSAFAEHLFGPDQLDTTYGMYFRIRQELWENAFDVDTLRFGNRNFFRFKTSAWANLDYDKKYALRAVLTNEAQYYINDYTPSNNSWNEDEIVFDNLYVDANNVFGLPVDLRLGRQNFLFTHGEGFLIMEGTPGDGSRTFYFNAAKANVKFSPNYNLDLIYITDPQTDTYLPSLHGPDKRRLTTSDEQGFVAYGRGKVSDKLSVEPYYMFKNEEEFGATPELDIHTVGARAVVTLDSWKIRGEFAHQFGEYDGGRDREANGGYAFVGRQYKETTFKPAFDLGFVYLSGDDEGTTDNEAWDPLFSQWPNWSELYIFTLVFENLQDGQLPAYWTNLMMFRSNLSLNFSPATRLDLWYNYLWADEETRNTRTAMFSNDSKERGHLPQAKINHVFSKKIDAYVLAEYFIPGDFYTDEANDALFLRWQVQIKL
jgi:hypothetical protein